MFNTNQPIRRQILLFRFYGRKENGSGLRPETPRGGCPFDRAMLPIGPFSPRQSRLRNDLRFQGVL